MQTNTRNMVSLCAASMLAISALAQTSPTPYADPARPARDGATARPARDTASHEKRANRLNAAVKSTDLIGMQVKNYQDQKLATVEDLAVDLESGRVVQVILSTGGVLGIGDRLTAVPPGALHHDVANKVLHLDTDKEKLKTAPQFEMARWAECCDSNHLNQVYRHYGEEPALTFIGSRNPVLDAKRNPDGSIDTTAIQRARETSNKDRLPTEHRSTIPASRLGQVQKATGIVGMPVKNLQDERVGNIENLLVDLQSGRVLALVISSGGFLGIRDELSAVPPSALGFAQDRDSLQLDTSKAALSQAPHFTAAQWPDFAQPVYADGIYRAYSVEPYFAADQTADQTADADNTGRNVRDRGDRTLTPIDQGNNKADLATTAQIRKEIIAGPSMSLNAKNVKIITIGGRVTLRGPVNSAEEKRLIGEIADRIAPAGNVDNQLEVRLTSSSN